MCIRKLVGALGIAAGLFVPVCHGQEFLDAVNNRASQLTGIHLTGVSVYSGWASSALPQSGYSISALQGTQALGPDVNYGATASLAWGYHREKMDVSASYSGNYSGMARYTELDAYGQGLSFSLNRRFGAKLTFNASLSANDSTMSQYLFQPSSLGLITQLPATFDDLAAAFAAGQFSSAQAASMLTGAPMMQSTARSLLLGNRVLTYSGQIGVSYSVSSRLQVHFSSFTGAGQTRLGGQQGVAPVNYIMPRSTGANAGAELSYSLSPRTQIGGGIESNRSFNHYQGTYNNTASASFGRKMGMHWFLSMHGGASYSVVTQHTYGVPQAAQMVGGGSLGFATGLYTLVATYDRSASDPFGYAVGTNTSTSAAWSWHHPGSRWSMFASVSQQQTRNTGFVSLSGWQASAGLNASLNTHTSLSLQYAYLDSTGTYVGVPSNIAVQSIRLSLGWAPQVVAR